MKRKQLFMLAVLLTVAGTATISCSKVPVPEKNPVYLSSKSQTYTTKVKNLKAIGIEYPYKGNYTSSESESNFWQKIEADWIDIYFKRTDGDVQKIKITVKENTDSRERQYTFSLEYKNRHRTMTVYQKGK